MTSRLGLTLSVGCKDYFDQDLNGMMMWFVPSSLFHQTLSTWS